MTSVIIPAHNESRVIGGLLSQLVSGTDPGELDIIVIANGCADDTAAVAASFGPAVRVLSLPAASKHRAMDAGDRAAVGFPRIYVDADVELRSQDVRELAAALRRPGILAVAPRRVLGLGGTPWPVRWYYDVWQRLPEVRRGLFGRGAVAVGEAGYRRLPGLPGLLADDLAMSLSFAASERCIVSRARVIVHTPRTFRDLLRRRVRVVQGVAQLRQVPRAPAPGARTRVADLLAIARRDRRMMPRVALFLSVTLLARSWAAWSVARRDYSGWRRDESSRDRALTGDPAGGRQTGPRRR